MILQSRSMGSIALVPIVLAGSMALARSGKGKAKGSSKGKDAACSPTCYPKEPKSANAGKVSEGCGVRVKDICQTRNPGQAWQDGATNLAASDASPADCKFPDPSASGKWADLSRRYRRLTEQQEGGMKADDVFLIPAKAEWSSTTITGWAEARCIQAEWYQKRAKIAASPCGEANDNVTCEAMGSKTAKALNIIQYRIDEAKKAQSAGNNPDCQAAAHDAVALARGLPRFKQKLESSHQWAQGKIYKTRWNGTLNEKQAFELVPRQLEASQKLFNACGGGDLSTTPEEEMSFSK